MRLLVTVLVLFAVSSLVSGQFGAGSAIYIPDKPKGSGIAYLYPFTGLAESGSKEFTIDMWFWAEKWTSEWKGTLLSIATVDDDNWIQISFSDLLYFKSDEGRFNFNITEPARTWQHYAVSVNANTLKIELFINGKSVGSPKASTSFQNLDTTLPLSVVLGNDQDSILGGFSPSSHAPGYYDNLRFWNKAFTGEEVLHQMSRDVNAATPNLIAAWDFEAGVGREIREIKTGRPEWSLSFGSSYATAADLQNKQFSKFENDIQVTWGPSHARCRGSGMTSGFSRGVRKVFHLRDITEFSEITMTSLSPLCKLEDASSRQSLITNSIISSSFAFIAPADGTENEYSLSYTAGGEAATIVFKLAQPITPTNFSVTFVEDAAFTKNVIKFGGVYQNPQTWRVRIYISRLPLKGRIQDQIGPSDENGVFEDPKNITEPMFVTGGYNQMLYHSETDEFGIQYTTLEYKVVDESRWDDLEAIQQLPSGIVTISITPGNDAPKLLSSTVTGTDPLNPKNVSQDEVTILQYDVFDSDGDDVLMEIISLPSHGDLWLSDKFGNKLHKLTTTAVGTQEVEQNAAKLLNFSSEYADKSGSWAATQVLGEPLELKRYGDSTFAWSPESVDGFGCKDIGSGDVFYTEFLHIKFNESVYVKELFSYENVGGGTLVGVRAKDPTTNTWKRLYLGASDVPIREGEYIVFKPSGMCGTWFLTDELYLEIDTCHRSGWNEIDAYLMVGTTDTNLGAVPPNSSILYVPHNGFVGEDSFEFVLTDCPGDRFRKSSSMKSFLKVSEAPSSRVQTLQSSEGSNEVLTLQGGPTWEITGSPKWGTIQINGLDSRQYDQISAGSIVRYRPDDVECKKSASAYKDSFVITTSTTRDSSSSQSEFIIYEIVGCSLSSAFPYWIFIVVGAVIVVACVVIFWFSTRQHRRMAALYNNNRVAEECAEAIAFMHLEEVSYLVTLPNPNKIQKAFLKIIQTLEEYRNFLPSSMFAGDTESVSESCTEMTSEIGHGDSSFYSNTGLPPRRVRGSGTASSASSKGTSTAMRSRLAHLQVSVLRKKQISMLCSNINGFKRIREDEIVQAHHDYLTVMVKAARDTRGVPEPFVGDRVMISWNAALAIPNYRELSCTCAIAISDGIKNMQSETNLKVSLGVASSGALVGNLGIAGMKKFAIIGGAYPAAVVLMRLNSKFSTEILAEGSYRVEALKFQMFPVSRVVYEKFSERPFVVFNVLSTRIEKNEEWMYSMQDGIHPVLDQLDAILMGKEPVTNFHVNTSPHNGEEVPIQTEAFMSKLAANPDYIDEVSPYVQYI